MNRSYSNEIVSMYNLWKKIELSKEVCDTIQVFSFKNILYFEKVIFGITILKRFPFTTNI